MVSPAWRRSQPAVTWAGARTRHLGRREGEARAAVGPVGRAVGEGRRGWRLRGSVPRREPEAGGAGRLILAAGGRPPAAAPLRRFPDARRDSFLSSRFKSVGPESPLSPSGFSLRSRKEIGDSPSASWEQCRVSACRRRECWPGSPGRATESKILLCSLVQSWATDKDRRCETFPEEGETCFVRPAGSKGRPGCVEFVAIQHQPWILTVAPREGGAQWCLSELELRDINRWFQTLLLYPPNQASQPKLAFSRGPAAVRARAVLCSDALCDGLGCPPALDTYFPPPNLLSGWSQGSPATPL